MSSPHLLKEVVLVAAILDDFLQVFLDHLCPAGEGQSAHTHTQRCPAPSSPPYSSPTRRGMSSSLVNMYILHTYRHGGTAQLFAAALACCGTDTVGLLAGRDGRRHLRYVEDSQRLHRHDCQLPARDNTNTQS